MRNLLPYVGALFETVYILCLVLFIVAVAYVICFTVSNSFTVPTNTEEDDDEL